MSQHSSLKVDAVGAKHRNVLKRLERIKKLQAEGKWEGRDSVLGLPKIKSIKFKVKKSAAKEGAASAAEGAAPAPAAVAKPAAKPAAAKPATKPAAKPAK